jgi:hypothetical protein
MGQVDLARRSRIFCSLRHRFVAVRRQRFRQPSISLLLKLSSHSCRDHDILSSLVARAEFALTCAAKAVGRKARSTHSGQWSGESGVWFALRPYVCILANHALSRRVKIHWKPLLEWIIASNMDVAAGQAAKIDGE